MINKRIENLRLLMEKENIDAYIVPSSDFHQSEYVGEYFEARKFISGFTGSAGTILITKYDAILWTDGRYFIQAEEELKNSYIKLYKMGEENVHTLDEYLIENMSKNSTLGFDGRVFSAKEGLDLFKKLEFKNVSIKYSQDLIDKIWEDRPSLPKEKAFLLDIKYSGETFKSKLERLRTEMVNKKATTHIIASLDDICWLFNLRGRDINFNPVVLSYAVVRLDEVILFIDNCKLDNKIIYELKKENVKIKEYNEVYEFIKNIEEDEVVLIDLEKINYSIYKNIPKNVRKIEDKNPIILFKAIKNNIEIENLRNCHIKDGVAVTKFIYWLKSNVDKIDITEISASDKLESLRKEQENFIEPSFSTISAYKDHGAIVHYRATDENNYKLEKEGLYLIDSGGQYLDGTTDITRTMALGDVIYDMKKNFTNVLRGMIRLSKAKFMYGCRGMNLDILARGPMWDNFTDYNHGTGHGIGYFLNVHEPPNGFRWKVVPERNDSCILEEGMTSSNEPGFYLKGEYGIRIENILLTKKCEKNEYGQFMEFETLTLAPIDLDLVDKTLMLKDEIEFLNNYHKKVFEKISPFLNECEKEWLKYNTREI